MEEEAFQPVIDRRYPLTNIADAYRYVLTGEKTGNVVITYKKYGLPEEMKLKEVEQPVPKANQVLVKVKAVSLNASDNEFLRGEPFYTRFWGLTKPKYSILGSDIAGEVVAIGLKVKHFKIGEAVLGDIMYVWGGLAEYVCVDEKLLVTKPDFLSFEAAAAFPQAGVVALQGLRDKGQLQAGQHVLINGAGGGSGSFAIQLAKHFGASKVTGIDNTGKQEFMRSIGADDVIDYTQEDFVEKGQQYDLIVDFVAHHSLFDYQKVLKPNGKYVLVGGKMKRLLQAAFLGPFIGKGKGQQFGVLGHEYNREDLGTLLKFYELGKIKPIIDQQSFTLSEAPAAVAFLGSGQAKGKVVITVA